MKHIVYFIPAATALLFYGLFAMLESPGAINQAAWFFVFLLFASAIILSRGKWWGAIFGVAVGIILIQMDLQVTGQLLPIELPVGIVFCIFFVVSGFFVYKKLQNK